MNYVVEELTLYRHFLLIDSPVPFELVANPINYVKGMDGALLRGRDTCSRPAGAWRVDCYKLLPSIYFKENPVFTMLLKYDADLLATGQKVDIRYSDIDVGEGIAGVNGQLVDISPNTFRPVIASIDDFRTANHADIDSFKNDVVDGLNGLLETENQNSANDLCILKSASPFKIFEWGHGSDDVAQRKEVFFVPSEDFPNRAYRISPYFLVNRDCLIFAYGSIPSIDNHFKKFSKGDVFFFGYVDSQYTVDDTEHWGCFKYSPPAHSGTNRYFEFLEMESSIIYTFDGDAIQYV